MITEINDRGPISAGPTCRFDAAYIWLVASVAAMGGLLFGWDWVVIGGAKPFFEPYFHLSAVAKTWAAYGVARAFGLTTEAALSGWANSCALLGCLLGSLLSGALSDRFGRKKLLLFSGFLFAISSLLTGWAASFESFIAWRIVGGVAIGIASNLSPLYIAEIAPAPLRGRLVTLNQLTIVCGVLLAQLANLAVAQRMPEGATSETIAQSWNGQIGWRWMFTLVAVPSVLFFVAAFFVPESPRWLTKNGQIEGATRVLARIGGVEYAADQVRDIQASLVDEVKGHSRWSELLSPQMLKILIIGSGLAVLQQWSGINVLFNYAENIFRQAGFGVNTILLFIVITGVVNLMFTFVALATVDRWGRRTLMLWGCAGITVSHLLIGLACRLQLKGVGLLIFALMAIGCYAMSLAPVTWVIIAEIFPNRVRGAAVSVAVSMLWMACFVLTYTFPLLERAIGTANTFWIYASVCLLGFGFVHRWVPETKGQTLESIEQRMLGIDSVL